MNFVLENTATAKKNDVTSGVVFPITGHKYKFEISPSCDFWRFGLRMIVGRQVNESGLFDRYSNSSVKHIEVCVGQPEIESCERWHLAKRIELGYRIGYSTGSLSYRADTYQSRSPIVLEITWKPQHHIKIRLNTPECAPYEGEIDLGAHDHFQIFGWAEMLPFVIHCDLIAETEPIPLKLTKCAALAENSILIAVKDLAVFFGRNNSGKSSILVAACNNPMDADHPVDYLGLNRNFSASEYDYRNEGRGDRKSLSKTHRRRRTQKDPGFHQHFDWIEELSLQDKDVRENVLIWVNEHFESWELERQTSGEYVVGLTVKANRQQAITQGNGARSILPIIIQLFNPDIKLLAIDEPEIGLEARLQKALFKAIKAASEGKGGFPRKRILLGTHSHLFIDRRCPENNFKVTKINDIVEVTPLKTKIDVEEAAHQLLGLSPADQFFPSNIIIVEGKADQIFLLTVYKLMIEIGEVDNHDIVTHFMDGIDNVEPAAVGVVQMFKTQSYAPIYRDRICGMFDKPNNKKSQSRVDEIIKYFGPNAEDRFLVLDYDAIEYFYPLSTINRIFGTNISSESYIELVNTFLQATKKSQTALFVDRQVSKVSLAQLVSTEITAKDISDINLCIRELIKKACEKGFD